MSPELEKLIIKYIEFGQLECSNCGPVPLTNEQYDTQMNKPNNGWVCPKCGSDAEWIDQDDMEDDYESAAF